MKNMEIVKKIVRPGVRIELRPYDMRNSEEEYDLFYQSKISDVKEDGSVEVYLPIEQGKLVLLSEGSRLDLYCYAASGIYECPAVVIERYKKEGLYFVLLRMTDDLKKNQRREYYRYQCTIPMQDRAMDEEERQFFVTQGLLLVDDEIPMGESTIVDISGGGLQFVGTCRYHVNDMVYCRFVFGKPYALCLKILDGKAVPDKAGQYRYRAGFMEIDKRVREEVIRHIFALERMKRKMYIDRKIEEGGKI